MTLRITDESQLPDSMSGKVRRQLERELQSVPPSGNVVHLGRPEEDIGRALITWIDKLTIVHPAIGELTVGDYFAHIPNGLARTKAEGGIFKAQGLRKGWPDYILDLPMGYWHGLRLELKHENGAKPDADQLDVLLRLERAGYCVVVAWGLDDAQRAIRRYLAIPE